MPGNDDSRSFVRATVAAIELHTNLTLLTPQERLDLFDRVTEGYCTHCGHDHLPCYCWNDE